MKFTFLITCLIIFFSCEKKAEINKFVGTWHDTEQIIPMKETLSINSDSTFTMESRACQGGSKAFGKWKVSGDSIILNSSLPKDCYIISEFGKCLNPINIKEYKIRKTIENCEPKNYLLYSEFKEEVFYIKNDSLIYKHKKDWNCPDSLQIIYAKTEKKKKKYDRNNNLVN